MQVVVKQAAINISKMGNTSNKNKCNCNFIHGKGYW